MSVLRQLRDARILEVSEGSDGALRVSGRSHCGRVRLPSGVVINIESKVPTLQLLQWLAFAEQMPELDAWENEPSLAQCGSVVDALAALFIDALTHVTRFHLRRGYAEARSVSLSFRGRLDVARLATCTAALPRLPVAHRERTFDTNANRVLARALDATSALSDGDAQPENVRRKRHWLHQQWSEIARATTGLPHAVALALGAPPVGYRTALLLARLVLYGAAIDAVGGDGGHIFLIDMSAIWERAFRRMLTQWAREQGIPVADDHARTLPWEDGRSSHDASRWLTADAILRGQRPIVFDTKYKRGYGCEAREDRFQVATYGLAFGAAAAVLVYPTAPSGWQCRRLLHAAGPHGDIEVGSMELPIVAGPRRCYEAFAESLIAMRQGLASAARGSAGE